MRTFDHNSKAEDSEDMTVEEAIAILSKHAKTDGKPYSPRPHMAMACKMAIEALSYFQEERHDLVLKD